jgi:hypothetical protein
LSDLSKVLSIVYAANDEVVTHGERVEFVGTRHASPDPFVSPTMDRVGWWTSFRVEQTIIFVFSLGAVLLFSWRALFGHWNPEFLWLGLLLGFFAVARSKV